MDFVTALSTGAKVNYAVTEYVYAFTEAVTGNPNNWLNKVSHNFVGQCFRVLGLAFRVSVEAFEETYDHPYDEDNVHYTFSPVPVVLKNIDSFLCELPQLLAVCEAKVGPDGSSSKDIDTFYSLTNPILCYLRMVNVWVMVVESIINKLGTTDKNINRFLCEPLARMSFSLLRGLVKLLPDYGDRFELLTENCLHLVLISRYGIFFEETCNIMLPQILKIFEEHFKLFFGPTKSALKFIYYVLICENSKKDSYIQAYQFLALMLDKLASEEQRESLDNLYLRLCTNELISDEFLVIQFEMLKVKSPSALLLTTIQYLDTLQRHLASTEIFTQRFLEQILLILLDKPNVTNSVSSSAAKLFVALTTRQYHRQDIFVHVLETFRKSQSVTKKGMSYDQFISTVKLFLKRLMHVFPSLQYMKLYWKIPQAINATNELHLFAAHFMFALFEYYTTEYYELELAQQQVHKLLRSWPHLIASSAQRPRTRAVIFSIYSIVDFKTVAQFKKNLLCRLEKHCLNMFLNDETLSEAEFSILFTSVCRSIEATGNEQLLVATSLVVQDKHAEINLSMAARDQAGSAELLASYGHSIRRLYALLKHHKLRGHQACEAYEVLATEMLRNEVDNEHLVLYGYECLALMLTLLHVEKESVKDADEHEARSAELAISLEDVCAKKLCGSTGSLTQIKSLFCAYVLLQLGMSHCLTLNTQCYEALCRHLSDTTLAAKAIADMLTLRHIQEMHLLFRRLHECDLELPINHVWKVLLQYKTITASPDYISPELEQLIVILIKRHISSYAHILCVIQLHIKNACSNYSRIKAVLSAHIHLVEAIASAQEAWQLRLYVFFNTLRMLVNRLTVFRSVPPGTKPRNHLFPLRQLLPLIDTLLLEEPHFVNIAQLLGNLQTKALTNLDTKELDHFINQISAHKYCCEDEIARASTANAQRNKLIPRPPGPIAFWQT